MELYQIRYFLSVARHLNFTHAAEDCHVTQPALTRAIKKLEDELGGELFRRERLHSHLTDLGRAMLPFLEQSFAAAMAAKAEADSYGRGDIAPLAVGLSHTVAPALLEPVLAGLADAVEGLQFSLVRARADEVIAALQTGDVDFAITARTDTNWERARHWPLFEEPLMLCLPAVRTDAAPAGLPADLPADLALIARDYCESTDEVRAWLAQGGDAPVPAHRAGSDGDALMLIGAGLGYAFLPRSSAGGAGVRAVAPENPPPGRTIVLMAAAGRRHSVAGSLFLRLMRSAAWPETAPV